MTFSVRLVWVRDHVAGQSDTYWLNLQKHYDIEVARETGDVKHALQR
jgi:plasmid maintenance system antidote protein VapI